jgi:hypothetical protein
MVVVFSKGEHVLDHTRVAKTQLSLLRSFLPSSPRFSNHKRLRKKIPLALSVPMMEDLTNAVAALDGLTGSFCSNLVRRISTAFLRTSI